MTIILSLSDRYKIFTNDWLWIEICQISIITLMIIENKALWLAMSFALSNYNHRAVIIALKARSFQNSSQVFYSKRLCSRDQSLTLLYVPFLDRKGTPFVYPVVTNGTPFTYLILNAASLFDCCKYTIFTIWINR